MKLKLFILILSTLSIFAQGNQKAVITFDTVADMVARGNPRNPAANVVKTLGYTARYDGGGSDYIGTNTVTSTNLGTRIYSGISGWSWELVRTDTVNIVQFGATSGSGDDSLSVQAAINSVTNSGGKVIVPDGNFISGNINLYSKVVLEGTSWGATLKQLAGSSNLLQINYNNAGTTNESDNIRGTKVRNLTLEGRLVEDGFFEQRHLLYMNAVSDIVVDKVNFVAPQGDAICVGGAMFGSSNIRRINKNILIQNNVFDGVVKGNRNGISVISGEDIRITKNLFKRLSQAGMPGPIDFEPNHDGDIIRDVKVEFNRIEDCLGDFGISIGLSAASTSHAEFQGARFVGNFFDTNCVFTLGGAAIGIRTAKTIEENTEPMGIVISGNIMNNRGSPYVFKNLTDLRYTKNTINGGSVGLISGIDDNSVRVYHAYFGQNTYLTNGNSYGQVAVGTVKYLTFENEVFNTPLSAGATAHVTFFGDGVVNTSSHTHFLRNDFIRGTNTAITATVQAVSHTENSTNNTYYHNKSDAGLLPGASWGFNTDEMRRLNVLAATTATLPDSFSAPIEETTIVGDAALPSQVKSGILRTYKPIQAMTDTAYRNQIIQFYFPGNLLVNGYDFTGIYYRRATAAANTWGQWHSINDEDAAYKAADYTLNRYDSTILMTSSGFTATLPDAATVYGKVYHVINRGGGTGAGVNVVSFNAAQLINSGNTNLFLPDPYDFATFQSSGDRWWVRSKNLASATIQTNASGFSLGDMTSEIAADTDMNYWVPLYDGTIVGVIGSVFTASSSGVVTYDIHLNGTSIMTTSKIVIDENETSTVTAATAPVLTTVNFSAGDRLTFDIDTDGTGAVGPQLGIYWKRR